MIEQLYNEERQCKEPAYIEATAQIPEIRRRLTERLDADGQILLEQLEALYIRQNNAILKDVYADGFSTAVKLILEALKR